MAETSAPAESAPVDPPESSRWLRAFAITGALEALSFLVLLGVGMPLKYFLDMPLPNKLIGWAHGVLFLLYLSAAFQAMLEQGWRKRTMILAFIAALIPFGPLLFHKRIVAG
ncbi:MAG: DUF3817 domain-containing protein [Myxococcota bacterium]